MHHDNNMLVLHRPVRCLSFTLIINNKKHIHHAQHAATKPNKEEVNK